MVVATKGLDYILNSRAKIAILRLFVSKTGDFRASGREIARAVGLSAPAAHAALKDLYGQGVVKLDMIGNQHIYRLDTEGRIVKNILLPMLKKEVPIKDEIKAYLKNEIRRSGVKKKIVSMILYGSVQRGTASERSDVDIAVIVKGKKDRGAVGGIFTDKIGDRFSEYFKAHLDTYIKTADEFRLRLKKNLPPVSTLMKSYAVIFGKEPLEI